MHCGCNQSGLLQVTVLAPFQTIVQTIFSLKMDNKNRPMTDIEKNNIKLLFHEKVNITNKKNICYTDYVLYGLDMTQFKKIVALRSKMGRFYEALFVCGFTLNKVGFDLINKEKNFILN